MDDVLGSAHVEVQFGDVEQQIQVVQMVRVSDSTLALVELF